MSKIKVNQTCGFYLCDELDCGFYYHYKEKMGPPRNHPLLTPKVLVVDLNKRVKIRLVGWGKMGFEKLLDHGHDGYIFPVNLFVKPFNIDPKLEGEEDEKWQKLIASFKGEQHVSQRRRYKLVINGEVVRTKLCNEKEFKETLEFQEKWMKRHPGEQAGEWLIEEKYADELSISVSQ